MVKHPGDFIQAYTKRLQASHFSPTQARILDLLFDALNEATDEERGWTIVGSRAYRRCSIT